MAIVTPVALSFTTWKPLTAAAFVACTVEFIGGGAEIVASTSMPTANNIGIVKQAERVFSVSVADAGEILWARAITSAPVTARIVVGMVIGGDTGV